MDQEDLFLNILRFDHPKEKLTVAFHRTKKAKGMVSLPRHKWPKGIDSVEGTDRLYTNFNGDEKGDYRLDVELSEHKRLARHYYNKLLFNAFKGQADVRRLNFINSNELWFRDQTADQAECKAYKRIELRVSVGRYTQGPELLVNFQGHRFLYHQPVIDYSGPTTDLNWVVYDGFCFRYDDIPEEKYIDHDKMYPVVNRSIRRFKKLGVPRTYVANKMKRYDAQLEWFRTTFVEQPVLQRVLPLNDRSWYRPKPKQVYRVAKEANDLVFGNNKTAKVPHRGMKQHGPYRPPSQRHIKLFFIVHKGDRKKIANRLTKYLKDGLEYFPGLPRYANVPIQFMDHHIVFEDRDNPLPEVKHQLRTMTFNDDMQYLAIYLSPIHKDEPDPKKRNVYYHLKEELLKYRVSSQVVNRESVLDDNFQYYLPNIGVAILAKLGGVPWQLKHPPRRELIVGVGAFRPRDKDQQYVGSAFCFSNKGEFRGFQCFAKKETGLLASSMREAVRSYVEEYGELDRLVIHYYKKMSYKERKPIIRMLNNLGLEEVSVVIVTINKTPSFDTVLFDNDYEGKMPVSGTYVRLDHHRLLLCNNTRYPSVAKKPRNFPFPVKVKIESDERGFMHDEKNVEEIMTQVYQFSRIYWKSISQQNLPVTIKYPEMVAQMFPYFESDIIPEFGRHNLWFL